jgi:phenylalanyl-tRNA synthetase beta chain
MLCSERELGLGDDAGGLMVLGGSLEAGEPLAGALGFDDVRLSVEVTANRPDLLSHRGIARELTPAGDASLALPEIPGGDRRFDQSFAERPAQVDEHEVSVGGVSIRIDASDLCSRYLGLRLTGVRIQPSPQWLQSRLRAIGGRPINNVVDATNYVLYECGQPLHAFDLASIRGRSIVVRRAAEGELICTLDREDRVLSARMLAICDSERPIAVAGVLGGADSEVSESTEEVLLECALFEPGAVRSTRRAMGLSTDASYRFERGVDPEAMRAAIGRAAELILATAGGRIEGPLMDVCPRPFARARVPLRLSRVERLLGIPLDAREVVALLEALGLPVEEGEGTLTVEVPGFRSYDVAREVDLIEEIARTHGYDAFPETLATFRPGAAQDHPIFRLEDAVRDELVASGVLEAQIPAFASEGEGEVELLNPVSTEEAFLRSRLLPGLQVGLEYNLRKGNREVRLFEVGTVFRLGGRGELPREETRVAAVLHGHATPAHWTRPSALLDLWDIKGILDRLVGIISERRWTLAPGLADGLPSAGFDPGSMFRVIDEDGAVRGVGGRLEEGKLDLPPWAHAVWALEIALPGEPYLHTVANCQPLPVHQGVDRDLALLVPGNAPVESVLSLIRERGGDELRGVEVFDVYRGPELPHGVRSVAVRLRFRAQDRTLRDQEVEDAVREVTRALGEELSVGFRGKHE